jgi:hypothetical protein
VRRLLLIFPLAIVAASLVAPASVPAARAATPVHFSATFPNPFTDTDSCGFPIDVNLQVTLVGTLFLDSQGNIQRAIVEQNIVGTDTANGVTLRDATHYVDFIDSLGGTKEVGLDFHVQNGGLILRNAGYLATNPDGSIAFVAGPHPFPDGDISAFCAAFS